MPYYHNHILTIYLQVYRYFVIKILKS